LHQRALTAPVSTPSGVGLVSIGTEGVQLGYRSYDIA